MKPVRWGIGILLAFDVLAIGGTIAWALVTVELSSAALFILWAIHTSRAQHADIHWNWLYPGLFGLGLVGFMQYQLGLTSSPYLTKLELLKWAAYLLLFFLTIESVCSFHETPRFGWLLILLGFFVSLFAIIQHFTSNGKLYWLIALRQGGQLFGPYVNRDHFAGFVELTVPLGLSMLLDGPWRRERLALLLLLTIIPIGALGLSASRAGIAVLFIESVILFLLSRKRLLQRKRLLVCLIVVSLAGAFTTWLGIGETVRRMELLTEAGSLNRRVTMYRDTWKIFKQHEWLGTGLGTLVVVYPRYESFYDGHMVEHAHCDYLELLSDTGLVGALFGFIFVVLLFWQGLANVCRNECGPAHAVRAGALTSCIGLLIHSAFDFNLHIPANALIFLLLAAIATSDVGTPSHVL